MRRALWIEHALGPDRSAITTNTTNTAASPEPVLSGSAFESEYTAFPPPKSEAGLKLPLPLPLPLALPVPQLPPVPGLGPALVHLARWMHRLNQEHAHVFLGDAAFAELVGIGMDADKIGGGAVTAATSRSPTLPSMDLSFGSSFDDDDDDSEIDYSSDSDNDDDDDDNDDESGSDCHYFGDYEWEDDEGCGDDDVEYDDDDDLEDIFDLSDEEDAALTVTSVSSSGAAEDPLLEVAAAAMAAVAAAAAAPTKPQSQDGLIQQVARLAPFQSSPHSIIPPPISLPLDRASPRRKQERERFRQRKHSDDSVDGVVTTPKIGTSKARPSSPPFGGAVSSSSAASSSSSSSPATGADAATPHAASSQPQHGLSRNPVPPPASTAAADHDDEDEDEDDRAPSPPPCFGWFAPPRRTASANALLV